MPGRGAIHQAQRDPGRGALNHRAKAFRETQNSTGLADPRRTQDHPRGSPADRSMMHRERNLIKSRRGRAGRHRRC